MQKCEVCDGEIKESTTTLKRKNSHGKEVRVLNVPAKLCGCKNEHSFSFHHGVIIEDFIKETGESRDLVDFKEIEQKYNGVSTMEILKKHGQ